MALILLWCIYTTKLERILAGISEWRQLPRRLLADSAVTPKEKTLLSFLYSFWKRKGRFFFRGSAREVSGQYGGAFIRSDGAGFLPSNPSSRAVFALIFLATVISSKS
jgi:hypothetical protein